MKDWEYNVTLVLSVICLVVAVWIVTTGRANEKLQAQLQEQQVEIDRGAMARQLGSRLVQEMAVVAQTNSGIRAIMEKYGFLQGAAQPPVGARMEKAPVVSGPVVKRTSEARSKDKSAKTTAGK